VPSPKTPTQITSEFLVVGEGSGDASFIENLCKVRDIQGFQVEDARGESKFPEYLKGLPDRRGYERLKGILIVGDSDDSPDANFNQIKGYLKDAKMPQPNSHLALARRDGVTVCVALIPYNDGRAVRGCLDTLLLRYIEAEKRGFAGCIDAFRACINGSRRSNNQEDKFKLRCFIAAMYPEDPNLSITFAVLPSKGLIDLRHSTFDEIAAFLQGFQARC
jgi:hypothetical protein